MSNPRKTIIMVDDNQTNLIMGKNMLRTFYQVFAVPSVDKMFDVLNKVTADLILLDIDMPDINGYEAIKKIKAEERFAHIPVIFITALDDTDSEIEGFNLGAVDYVTKPFSAPLLIKRIEKELFIVEQRNELIKTQAELREHLANLENKVQEKTDEIKKLHNTFLSAIVELVEFRDQYTGGHILRTQHYVKTLIDEMLKRGIYHNEIADWDVAVVLETAKLHDVGKIAIPDIILRKPDRLTPEEFEDMKNHVTAGVEAMERIIGDTESNVFLSHALHIIGTHHEKWDGSGYPIGLKGKNIPLEGRLMAIVDVYDALISTRPYKKAFSHEEACKIIEEGAGKHFDPELVTLFSDIKDRFKQIASENE